MSVEAWRELERTSSDMELASIGVRLAVAAFYARTEVPERLEGPTGEV